MGNASSNLDRTQIVLSAFRRIGIDFPSPNDQARGAERLNDVVSDLDYEGRWLWKLNAKEAVLQLNANQSEYTVGDSLSHIRNFIFKIEKIFLETSANENLRQLSFSDFVQLKNEETTSSRPYAFYFERSALPQNQKLHFIPTPNANETARYYYQEMLFDFENPDSIGDLFRGMRLKIIKILAAELAHEYGVPLQERDYLNIEARLAKIDLRRMNVEKYDRETAKFLDF